METARLVGDVRRGFATPLGYPGKRANRPAVKAGNVRRWWIAIQVVGRSIVDLLVEVACDHAQLILMKLTRHLVFWVQQPGEYDEKLPEVYVEELLPPRAVFSVIRVKIFPYSRRCRIKNQSTGGRVP